MAKNIIYYGIVKDRNGSDIINALCRKTNSLNLYGYYGMASNGSVYCATPNGFIGFFDDINELTSKLSVVENQDDWELCELKEEEIYNQP